MSKVQAEIREVVLRNKPAEMLASSPKGTVPVLVLPGGKVIDESLEIMQWASARGDNGSRFASADLLLIADNDGPFKAALDRYKYPHRYDLTDGLAYRSEALVFVAALDRHLLDKPFLAGDDMGFTDIAIAPFIRQFAATDREWFAAQELIGANTWLDRITSSALFETAMTRYPAWRVGDAITIFPQ